VPTDNGDATAPFDVSGGDSSALSYSHVGLGGLAVTFSLAYKQDCDGG